MSHSPRSLYSEIDGRDGAAVGGSVILGVGEEEEFRDTIQLHYKEEVRRHSNHFYKTGDFQWREGGVAPPAEMGRRSVSSH